MVVNSAADWGRSDPLLTVRTAEAMLTGGFDEDDVDKRPLAQPGRVLRAEWAARARGRRAGCRRRTRRTRRPAAPAAGAGAGEPVAASAGATFEGNSVLRGSRDG